MGRSELINGGAGAVHRARPPGDVVRWLQGAQTLGSSNGGPTQTHALEGGSPATDTVTDGTCPPPARDQRGVKRPQDGDGDGGRRVISALLNGSKLYLPSGLPVI
jgi:hypothetical protein